VFNGEAANTNFIYLVLTQSGLQRMFYRTSGKHVQPFSPQMQFN